MNSAPVLPEEERRKLYIFHPSLGARGEQQMFEQIYWRVASASVYVILFNT